MRLNLRDLLDSISPYVWRNKQNNELGGHVLPDQYGAYDIGSATRPLRAVYANNIIGSTAGSTDELVASQSGGTPGYLGAVLDTTADLSLAVSPTNVTISVANTILRADGSVELVGNLPVANGVTIDGTDISAHVANVNAHHNRDHELATNVGLGATHFISGATVGDVLAADSATTARFRQLLHDEIDGVTANQHHNQVHDITGTDHTITGAQWQVVGATALDTLGLITPASSTLTTAEALLKTDGAGGVYLRQFGVGTNSPASMVHFLSNTGQQLRIGYDDTNYMDFNVDGGGSWTIAPTGDVKFDPGGNDVHPVNNYDLNLGLPQKKWLSIHAAELWVDTLVASEVRSTIGGEIWVAPTTELTRDLAGADVTYDTVTQRGSTQSANGIGGSGYETITFVNSSFASGNTNSLSVNIPSGTVDDDVMIAVVVYWIETLTPPTGWTQIGSTQTWSVGGDSIFARVYYRVAASEGSSYSWQLSGANDISVAMSSYSNVNVSSVVDAQAGQYNGSNTVITAPSVSPTTDADMLVFLGAAASDGAGSASTTPPSGMTERADQTNVYWVKTYIADELLSTSGATGTRAGTLSTSENNAAWLVALTPSGSTGTTTVNVTPDAGTTTDDQMIAVVSYAGGTLTPQAGWIQILSQAGTGVTLEVYRRTAGASEGATTWALSTGDGLAVSISSYYNVDTTSPVSDFGAQANSSSTNMVAPSITPVSNQDMLIFAGAIAGNIRATAPSGMTEEADHGNTGIGQYAADQTLASASDTGTRVATLASAATSVAALVALTPSYTGGAAPTTIYVKYNNLSNGDIVFMEARGRFEAMAVASAATEITPGEEYSYTVTRNLDGTGSDDWIQGDAIVNTGQTGLGWMELYAQYGFPRNGQSATQRVGPTIVGNVRSSNTFNDFRERWAVGNLNGLYDFSGNSYGLAAGNPSATWISLDDTNGLRFMNSAATVGYIQPNGNWQFYGDASNYIQWDGSQLHVRGDILVDGMVGWDNINSSVNIVQNSSFEIFSSTSGIPPGFNIYNNDGGAVPTTASIVDGTKSTKALRISWTGTNASTKGIWFTGTQSKMANVDYILSFWARTSTSTSIEFYENAPAATREWLTSQASDTTWRQYAVRLNWGSTPAANWYISVVSGAAILNGWIEFDNVQVVESDVRVPYTTSPFDLVSRGGAINMPAAPSGSGLYLTSTHLGYYAGSPTNAWRTYMQSNGDFYLTGAGSSYLSWVGGTLTVSGTINVVSGNAARTDFSNITATLDNVSDGSTYKRTTTNEKTGASRAYTNIDASNVVVARVDPGATWGNPNGNPSGLMLGSDVMGYWDNTAGVWRTYMDASGNFQFGATGSNYIQYNASLNRLRGVGGGVEQWYADGTTGRLYAANGVVWLDYDGINIKANATPTGYSTQRAIDFISSYGSSTIASIYAGDASGSSKEFMINLDAGAQWAHMNMRAYTNSTSQYSRLTFSTDRYGGDYASIVLYNGVSDEYFEVNYDRTYISSNLVVGSNLTVTSGTVTFPGAANSMGAWTAFPFAAGWGNYPGYKTCEYRRVGDIIQLRGLAIYSSGGSALVGTLPSGFRPGSATRVYLGTTSSGVQRIDISTSGTVSWVSASPASGNWVSLEAIAFCI